MTTHPEGCRCLIHELGLTAPEVLDLVETIEETATGAFGLRVEASVYRPQRDLVAQPERSGAGNVVLRIGREIEDGEGWTQVGHVVLEAREAVALATAILDQVSPVRPVTA